MGEKKDGKNKKGDGEGEKKAANMTIVMKVDMHCEGCASKIVKCVRDLEGVSTVKSDFAANKLTIIGNVDPFKIREKLEQKTKKKVDVVSPQPKKDREKGRNDANNTESKPEKKENNVQADDKKTPKQPPVSTAVLKLSLHCNGCIGRIDKAVRKIKGVQEVSIDKQKELVTVKGTMDVKSLSEHLAGKLKKPVTIVPPKKEKTTDGEEEGKGKKKKGGKPAGNGGGDGHTGSGNGGGKVVEGGKAEFVGPPVYEYGYIYGHGYGPSGFPLQYHPIHYPVQYPVQYSAPQMFSDENPHACSLM